MTTALTIRSGTARQYPQEGDRGWAADATAWATDATNAINNSPTNTESLQFDAIVGSAIDVASGNATHTDIATAIAAVAANSMILLLDGTYSQAAILNIDKAVTIIGQGEGSVIDSTAGIAAGAIVQVSVDGVSLWNLLIDDGAGTPDYAIQMDAGVERVKIQVKLSGTFAIAPLLNNANCFGFWSSDYLFVFGNGDAQLFLKDNDGNALQIGSTGVLNLLQLDTTTGAAGMTVNGYLNVTGTIDMDAISLNDLDDSNNLVLIWNEDDVADRNLYFKVNGATRTLDLTGNLTISANLTTTGGAMVLAAPGGGGTFTMPAATDTLVGRTSTDTLTNKTIDGDDNTVQDLALTTLKTVLGHASTFVVRDAAGVVVSGTKNVPTGDIVGTSDAQTLTNKTIDGDNNTISDVAITSLKTDLGAASTFISRDAAGAIISTKAVPAGAVVGTSDAQTLSAKTLTTPKINDTSADHTYDVAVSELTANRTVSLPLLTGNDEFVFAAHPKQLTNKDYDGGTASDTSRITLPKNTTANIAGLARKEGTLLYDTTKAAPVYDDGAAIIDFSAAISATVKSAYWIENCSFTATVAGNALTVALKGNDGNDPSALNPVKIGFRSATITSSVYSIVSAVAATSVTVSSGSTLGTTNGDEANLYVYAINNAGTIELGIINGKILDEGSVNSSTAEGGAGAADAIATLYSTTARANIAVRLLGRIRVTEAAAGTWATAPSAITPVPFKMPVCSFRAYKSGAAQTITAGAGGTAVLFETENHDLSSNYNTATSTFTAPYSGLYYLYSQLHFVLGAISPTNVYFTIYKNGATTLSVIMNQGYAATGYFSETLETVALLDAGDTVQLLATAVGQNFQIANGDGYTIFHGYAISER
jgi:hypothetical protein